MLSDTQLLLFWYNIGFCGPTHQYTLSFYWELEMEHIQGTKEDFYGSFKSHNDILLVPWHPNVSKISSFLGILELPT